MLHFTGLPTSDDDGGSRNDTGSMVESHASGEGNGESVNVQHNVVPEVGDLPSDVADCVVKCKSVFKCKLCPRIVCLTEDSLKAHLKSKVSKKSDWGLLHECFSLHFVQDSLNSILFAVYYFYNHQKCYQCLKCGQSYFLDLFLSYLICYMLDLGQASFICNL